MGERDGSMRAIFLAAIMVLSVLVMGIAFAGSAAAVPDEGSGTVDDPYVIDDWNDLNAIDDDSDAYYILEVDLDKDTSGYDSNGFDPLSKFEGNFDGNGHVISDLDISASSDYSGLFKTLGGSAVVKHLDIKNADVDNTKLYTGVLAGNLKGTAKNVNI
jgi:surface glycoprotein (TIGR04207 family)